ncbi:MAG: hypothetical protein ACHQD8_05540 [Chitinophagales bacterium]
MQVTKYVLPVVVGAMSGMILIILGENWIETLYPLLPGTDKYDVESLAKAIKLMPDNAFRLLLVNYMVCSFCAGLIATLISKRTTMRPPLIVGFVLTLAGLYNVISLPHPLWFTILNLVVYMPFTWLGYLTMRKKVGGKDV